MKTITPARILTILCIALFGLLFSCIIPGCSSQKHITTTKWSVDSSVLKEQSDSLRVLTQENATLTMQLHELQYAGVIFDTSHYRLSDINVPADCNVDSILALLNDAKDKVKIYTDGTIEAEGKLKSAYYSKDKLSRVISDLHRVNDSLHLVKNKEVIRYVTNTVTVEKTVKRKWFTGWGMWIMLIIAAYLFGRFQKMIMKFLRPVQ